MKTMQVTFLRITDEQNREATAKIHLTVPIQTIFIIPHFTVAGQTLLMPTMASVIHLSGVFVKRVGNDLQ